MGVVYEAVDTVSAESVALKKLADVEQGHRRSRFVREAQLMEVLEHPGIVRIREVVEAGGALYLAMDLVRGESLRAKLDGLRAKGESLTVASAVRIARQTAEVLSYAHDKGVIHRDLKPENVMLSHDEVFVLDFGLAKLREVEGAVVYDAETASSLTQDGQVIGTPAYMAPEQARGREVGFRADVFSLGVVLYEMLTLERPFSGVGTIDLIVAITQENPGAPSTKNAAVPRALDELVLRCLAKKPEARPSMSELVAALQALERDEGGAEPRARRAPRVFALAGLAIVIVAGAALELHAHENKVSAAPNAPPKVQPTAITDLPPPASTVVDARSAYHAAIQDERDGAEDAALIELDRAVKLDPDLAAAHLRLAMRLAFIEAQNARTHFARAVATRDRLTARDGELLDAMRPVFQQDPSNVQAWADNVAALAERYPGDAELALEAARAKDALGDFRGSARASARASAIDPRFALALASLAQEQAYLGELDPARQTISKCLSVSASASWCIWVGEFMDGLDGRCAANEKSARDRIALDPTIPDGYKALAFSLAALDRPESAVREATDQAVLRTAEGFPRQRLSFNMAIRIDVMHGRFQDAVARSDALRTLLAARSDVGDHAMPAWIAADLELELGHDARAATIAKDFLDRKDVWQIDPVPNDYALANDLTPRLLAVRRHTGAISEADYDVAMRAWRSKWEGALRGSWRPYLWVYGYAAVAETPEDGKKAVDALRDLGPIPPFLVDGDVPEASVGRALWLGGFERGTGSPPSGSEIVRRRHAPSRLGALPRVARRRPRDER